MLVNLTFNLGGAILPSNLPAPVSNKELLAMERDKRKAAEGKLRESRANQEPTGLSRLSIVGSGGFTAGLLSEVKMGEFMGQKIGADLALPVVSLAIDYGTDGQLPGGAVGKMCRVIRAGADHEVSHGAYLAGKWTAQKARAALLA